MSEFFAEATVQVRPDLTGFVKELRTQLKSAIESVETTRPPKVKVGPALTRNFVGDLRRQVNLAVAQAQRGVKPITVRAQIAPFGRGQLREVQAASVRGTPGRASAELGAGLTEATRVGGQFATTQERINGLVAQGAVLLGQETTALATNTAQRAAGARSQLAIVEGKAAETAASAALANAIRRVTAISFTEAGTKARTIALSRAQAAIVSTLVLAEEENAAAITATARSLQARLATMEANNAALRQQATEVTRAARSQEQLRRGALATSLSFLGIRGATLAASASFLAGAAAIGVLAKALQNASNFTDQLNAFRATTQASAEELERVGAAARALGADLTLPGVSAADAATAMVELAKAGLDVQNSIEGARGVLQLATAAAIDNAQAVELVANALNSFELAGRDATRVADVFGNAANAAQGSIVDIGIAFQQASAAGRQVGLSFEDTAEFLTVLAQNGLKGSDAGTSLRTALIRLVNPSEEAGKRLRQLGIEVRDAQGNLRPDVFIQIAEATKTLTPAARDAVVALVGGQDAFRAISILGRQSIKDFIALRKELREQGTAAELAAARNQGLRGSLDALGNSLSTAGIGAGRSLTPALQDVIGGLTATVNSASTATLAGQTFQGVVESLNIAVSALGTTLTTVAPLFQTFVGVQAAVINSVGVPTILAAVAAYKLLPAVLGRATAAYNGASASAARFVAVNARAASFTGLSRAQIALAQLTRGFNLTTIAAAGLAAGLFFLLTRESDAERATRKLKEATDDLISSQEKLRTLATTQRDTGLGENAARLGVFEAQQQASAAKRALATTAAAKGTFERTKLELQLAVALDNVKIAQNALGDAVQRSRDAQDQAAQAARNAADAQREEVDALKDLVSTRITEARVRAGRSPEQQAQVQANAIKSITKELEKRAQAAREENSVESLNFARRIETLNLLSRTLKQVPTERAIEITVNTDNALQAARQLVTEFGITGKKLKDALFQAFTTPTTDQAIADNLLDLARSIGIDLAPDFHDSGIGLGRALDDGIATGVDQNKDVVAGAVTRALNRVSGLQRQGLDLEIANAPDSAILANLQAQAAEQRRILEIQRRKFEGHGKSKVAAESVRRAQENLNQTLSQIRSIQEQMRSDAKQAADDAKQRQQDIDNALLEAMGFKRDTAQERIENAGATPGLRDDIARTRALRQLVLRQIKQVQDEIKTTSVRIAAVRELRRISRDLAREIAGLQRDRAKAIQDRIAESIQLDIDFAHTKGNVNAEIRARQREIARLRKLQKLAKDDALERKRLRNAIAEQQTAIDELRKQREDGTKKALALQKAEFNFLQTIQGFAFNLLGNLIPGGATGGLVGGSSPSPPEIPSVAKQLHDARTKSDAKAERGITSGQGNTQIDLLRQIRNELKRTNRGLEHPEARHQRKQGSANMDFSYQGTHGM